MKLNALALSGLVVLLLALGSPSTPESASAPVLPSDDGEATDSGPVLPVVVSDEPEPEDTRPQVRMYRPVPCAICEQLYRDIENAGGYKAMPFDLVILPLLDWMEDGPWFYWENEDSPSGWVRLHGLKALNGSRLQYLLQEWQSTQPEGEREQPPGVAGTIVCCCDGIRIQPGDCLCVDELKAGIERPVAHCTCTPQFGSRHKPEGGPAGGYRLRNGAGND